MNLRPLLTRKNILIVAGVAAVALAAGAYFALRRPAPVAMERYVPATALAFVEIRNLADVIDGLTDTRAWEEIAPLLGLSSQLRQLGLGTDLMSRTGIGPQEAVIAGRAQFAVALTGLEAEPIPEEAATRLKPLFTLIVETHAGTEAAAKLVRERSGILARRIYGGEVGESTEDYFGTPIYVFHGPQPGRQLVAASFGGVALIANHSDSIRQCLDTIAGRAAPLANDETLKQTRPQVDDGAEVFGYVSERSLEKLVEFGSAMLAGRLAGGDMGDALANLFGHMSKQTTSALLYSSTFAEGGVIEKFLTVLKPEVAESLAAPLKPAPRAALASLRCIPREVEDVTVLAVEGAGALPERLLKQLAPRLDIVASMALREFVLAFREQLGLRGEDSLGGAVGDEVAFVRFGGDAPVGMIIAARDREALRPHVRNYLSEDGATITTESHNGVEIFVSSNRDGRAAAFAGDFLMLATREQIARMIDALAGDGNLWSDEAVQPAMAKRPLGASIISLNPRARDAGETLLAISKLTRVTDGSPEILERAEIQAAINRLPATTTFTEFRSLGVYTESRSAVGSYSLIASMVE